MKKVVIVGANSYIGYSLKQWLENWPEKYQVMTVSSREGGFSFNDFHGASTVVHLAALVHVSENLHSYEEYRKINTELAESVIKAAKFAGVRHCIFMSTMSIYGVTEGEIGTKTQISPKSKYGCSKYEAEKSLSLLEDKDFKIAYIRAPLVYGKGCKGNFKSLIKLVKILPFFPRVQSKRSMLYIDNLSELLKQLIDTEIGGYFHPQNRHYVSIDDLVSNIAISLGKRIYFSKIFNPFIKRLHNEKIKKVFGSLFYSEEISKIDFDFETCDFIHSIKNSVR